ncbi:helix-turn-helix transcriptional regulator [Phaeobacter gallaeciensis]|uniref:helix-turn-helix domain-containing protein n=1 Tax=Phaeobacter gallaeciensis TaxID=60890 RepID=UPI00237F418A|nr:helix-turn-helix transcriptional regulator [Phaeobacter gallaeciensis]MDE4306258.1 helix-turn-helix transcriptional regulator [Phaeobacter gallaeciensis]MDE4310724.1 helix-turn-helix transcriptional regulator [Phaeobacter gallaeciensis]MDE4315145.1 helix-turn-helix transcriptional regulator [Phaeobacter gallaeciensis]MDE4319670.1 helix-turn-helix transcriptional regulator [Phaeobacter gallaeciensis]MDE4324098.1 helix-turn-helix transcriptional regulator [Phaeobacter gallaeciensis]
MAQSADTLEWAKKIGSSIRSRRKRLGLSLEDLSRLSGSTVPTLSHIERGTRDVKLSTLVSLSQALRTELPDLFQTDALSPAKTVSPDPGQGGYDLEDD